MNDIEKLLLELYNNEDISIGAHGTALIKDEKYTKANEICKNGLMCRYDDLRRTVAFQDRGLIHAHGNIKFEELINYSYGNDKVGYVREIVRQGNVESFVPKKVDLEQVSYILAIPKDMKTTDEALYNTGKRQFATEYANNLEDLSIGKNKQLMGRQINPKYIVGYYINGDNSTFKSNPLFYGFKQAQQEGHLPELDFDAIKIENERIKQINEQKLIKSTQELGKETITEQKNTEIKRKFSTFLKDLVIRQNRAKDNKLEETRED